MMTKLKWQSRYRGSWRWQDLDAKPDTWLLQCEYRSLNEKGQETWRSPPVNGYEERP